MFIHKAIILSLSGLLLSACSPDSSNKNSQMGSFAHDPKACPAIEAGVYRTEGGEISFYRDADNNINIVIGETVIVVNGKPFEGTQGSATASCANQTIQLFGQKNGEISDIRFSLEGKDVRIDVVQPSSGSAILKRAEGEDFKSEDQSDPQSPFSTTPNSATNSCAEIQNGVYSNGNGKIEISRTSGMMFLEVNGSRIPVDGKRQEHNGMFAFVGCENNKIHYQIKMNETEVEMWLSSLGDDLRVEIVKPTVTTSLFRRQ